MSVTYQVNYQASQVSLESLGALAPALRSAITACPGSREEEGGIITRTGDTYEFTRIRNANTGTPVATALYSADRVEYGQKIIPKFDKGAVNDSSFHTHPRGCRALPSGIDLRSLFNGFPRNIIWSPSLQELNIYTFAGRINTGDTEVVVWDQTTVSDYLFVPSPEMNPAFANPESFLMEEDLGPLWATFEQHEHD